MIEDITVMIKPGCSVPEVCINHNRYCAERSVYDTYAARLIVEFTGIVQKGTGNIRRVFKIIVMICYHQRVIKPDVVELRAAYI